MNLAPALLYPAVHWMDETQTSTSDQSGVGVCLLYFVRQGLYVGKSKDDEKNVRARTGSNDCYACFFYRHL